MAPEPSPLDRRSFLTVTLAALLASPIRGLAAPQERRGAYGVDVGLLWGTVPLRIEGTLEEAVDRAEGRYVIKAVGEGSQIANRIESSGVLRGGRWAPVHAQGTFDVVGRHSSSDIRYDYGRRAIEYKFRSETFFLRRQRVADDVMRMPEGHLDDVFSAVLNYADRRWPAEPDGRYRTQIVRRQRPKGEGPDDAQKEYKAEIVPFALHVVPDRETGRATASLDLAPFSSWAKDGVPARIVFGPDRRPETITASLALGTSLSVRLRSI